MKFRVLAGALAAGAIAISAAFALDQNLPAYQPVSGVSGKIKSVGSDTLYNVMAVWAKGFEAANPGVKIDVEGNGSATAQPALLEGASQFAPMSRPMTADEIGAFEGKYGYKPVHFRVAVDALAIYVNKDNPISCLTLPQLDQIFSSSRKASGGRSLDTWGDVGLTGEWAAKPISLYGRNSISGTHEFVKKLVLLGGDFRHSVKQQADSAAVVEAVARDKFAIGYSSAGFKTDGVRIVPLSAYEGRECYGANAEATYAGKYPIARYLLIYLNKKPGEALDPTRAEFIKYILSRDGQIEAERDGFFPLTSAAREKDLKKLGLSAVAN